MRHRAGQFTFFFGLAFFCLLGLDPLPAATLVWLGGDGYWTNAANWTPAQVPGPGDTASIASGTVTLTGDVDVQTLNLNGGGLTGAGAFQGVLNWSGGAGAFNAVTQHKNLGVQKLRGRVSTFDKYVFTFQFSFAAPLPRFEAVC